jgi:glycosyltransferase involved in cell wall biosynthesis
MDLLAGSPIFEDGHAEDPRPPPPTDGSAGTRGLGGVWADNGGSTKPMKPRISVILPVYNGAPHLREALDSILGQSISDLECIVIDDGSTDSTGEIINSCGDPRIRCLRNTRNEGIVRALNQGLAAARGEFIARMDADDISLPRRLETQLAYLARWPEVALCGSWTEVFGARQLVLDSGVLPETSAEIKSKLLFHNAIAHPTVFARRGFFLDSRYEESYQTAEDYALWTATIGRFRFANVQQVLLRYREGDTQSSTRHRQLQRERADAVLRRYVSRFAHLSDEDWRCYRDFLDWHPASFAGQMRVIRKILKCNQASRFCDPTVLRRQMDQAIAARLSSRRFLARVIISPLGGIEVLRFTGRLAVA